MSGAPRNNKFWKQNKPLNWLFRHMVLLVLAKRSKYLHHFYSGMLAGIFQCWHILYRHFENIIKLNISYLLKLFKAICNDELDPEEY
jgi:hypothetical protein